MKKGLTVTLICYGIAITFMGVYVVLDSWANDQVKLSREEQILIMNECFIDANKIARQNQTTLGSSINVPEANVASAFFQYRTKDR